MGQMSWRTDDELLMRVRNSAAAAGISLNTYVTRVLTIATSEDEQGGEAERLRQRLRAAGVLADSDYRPRQRPNDADVEAAARHAGQGTPLSDLVAHMRT